MYTAVLPKVLQWTAQHRMRCPGWTAMQALRCTELSYTEQNCIVLQWFAMYVIAYIWSGRNLLIMHCTKLHCTALQCIALNCTKLHCTVLYCTVPYCTALHSTLLHWPSPFCSFLQSTFQSHAHSATTASGISAAEFPDFPLKLLRNCSETVWTSSPLDPEMNQAEDLKQFV